MTNYAVLTGEGLIRSDTLAVASGPVFTSSGQALEAMKRRLTMTAIPEGGIHAIVLCLAAEIMSHWTEAQAEVALHALAPKSLTQGALANLLYISQQGMQKHIDVSGIDGLFETCERRDGR